MGGGLNEILIWIGGGDGGHHPAGKQCCQAKTQKRPPSLLSHVKSPSLSLEEVGANIPFQLLTRNPGQLQSLFLQLA